MRHFLSGMASWTTQSMGHSKTHRGRVVSFVPANTSINIPNEFHPLPWSRARISAISRNDRYLIVVNEGITFKEALYAPIAFTVRKGI